MVTADFISKTTGTVRPIPIQDCPHPRRQRFLGRLDGFLIVPEGVSPGYSSTGLHVWSAGPNSAAWYGVQSSDSLRGVVDQLMNRVDWWRGVAGAGQRPAEQAWRAASAAGNDHAAGVDGVATQIGSVNTLENTLRLPNSRD